MKNADNIWLQCHRSGEPKNKEEVNAEVDEKINAGEGESIPGRPVRKKRG